LRKHIREKVCVPFITRCPLDDKSLHLLQGLPRIIADGRGVLCSRYQACAFESPQHARSLLFPYPSLLLLLSDFTPNFFLLLCERAVLRKDEEVAVVTLASWHQDFMIAATEIPAQLLLLRFGVFQDKTQQAGAGKNAKGCLKADRLVLMIPAPLHSGDRGASRGKGFANTCVRTGKGPECQWDESV